MLTKWIVGAVVGTDRCVRLCGMEPLLVPISGEIRIGAEVEYRMTQPNGTQSTMKSRIGKVVALKELHQHAGIPGVLTAHHSYRLEPTQGGTRVIQHEVDNGVAMLF